MVLHKVQKLKMTLLCLNIPVSMFSFVICTEKKAGAEEATAILDVQATLNTSTDVC